MATKNAVLVPDPNIHHRRVKWLLLANGDDGQAIGGANPAASSISTGWYPDRTVQITGTFGAAGSVSILGSNDGGTTWATLTDPLGNALTFTSAGMKQITELPHLLKPSVTAGDGTTAINVWLHMRGAEK